eukprot:jgi/Phyca11/21804/fgenesh1_pg.PHYCAscaffold_127_\
MELVAYENVGVSLSEEEVMVAVTDVFSYRTLRLLGRIDWVMDYYQMHAVTVWRALWDRVKKNGTLKKWRYSRKRRKKVSFDCSSLYKSEAEALGEQEFKTGDDTDASSYLAEKERRNL